MEPHGWAGELGLRPASALEIQEIEEGLVGLFQRVLGGHTTRGVDVVIPHAQIRHLGCEVVLQIHHCQLEQ
jgi:hypothetical protein